MPDLRSREKALIMLFRGEMSKRISPRVCGDRGQRPPCFARDLSRLERLRDCLPSHPLSCHSERNVAQCASKVHLATLRAFASKNLALTTLPLKPPLQILPHFFTLHSSLLTFYFPHPVILEQSDRISFLTCTALFAKQKTDARKLAIPSLRSFHCLRQLHFHRVKTSLVKRTSLSPCENFTRHKANFTIRRGGVSPPTSPNTYKRPTMQFTICSHFTTRSTCLPPSKSTR